MELGKQTKANLGNQYENLRSLLPNDFMASVEASTDPVTSRIVPGLWVVRGSLPEAWQKSRGRAD